MPLVTLSSCSNTSLLKTSSSQQAVRRPVTISRSQFLASSYSSRIACPVNHVWGQHSVGCSSPKQRWPKFRRACMEGEEIIEDLRVPEYSAADAEKESEWLRAALHEWLDNEYCPEPANIEISRRCARAYYRCLLEGQLDIGDILMAMVRDLETFSFKESFHGAFSSANAAVDLITKKMMKQGLL